MRLDISISNLKTKQRMDMKFPAQYSAIEDALFRLNCDEEISASGMFLDEYGMGVVNFYFETCNIFELNYLATLIQNFDDEYTSQFIGAYFLMGQKEQMDVHKAINLAMNIKSNDIVCLQPAIDERDLADFYLDNELIPELDSVDEDIYQWIVDHTDLQRLGEEIVQKENGTFISGDYVTMEKLENLYDGILRMPQFEPYVFKLEVGYHLDNDDISPYTLTLPATQTEIDEMIKYMGVNDLSELNCYKFQSIVPAFEPMDFGMTEVETLNELATSIGYFKENGELNTYKAMVDALDVVNLESVHNICEYVGDFELMPSVRDFASYDNKNSESNGVSITAYGALVPKDGVPLMEKLVQAKEAHWQTTTIEQTM